MSNIGRKRVRSKSVRRKKAAKKMVTGANLRLGTLHQTGELAVHKLGVGLLGTQFRTKQMYFEPNSPINPGVAGVADARIFSCNGIYDPDISGTGHQPTGFDEFMAFYDHYRVISAKAFVHFRNEDATNTQFVGCYVSDRPSFSLNIRDLVENGRGSYLTLDPAGAGVSTGDVEIAVNVSAFLGTKIDEKSTWGTNAANPTEQCYFIVWAGPDSSADSAAVRTAVRIEYIVEYKEPVRLTIS